MSVRMMLPTSYTVGNTSLKNPIQENQANLEQVGIKNIKINQRIQLAQNMNLK